MNLIELQQKRTKIKNWIDFYEKEIAEKKARLDDYSFALMAIDDQ